MADLGTDFLTFLKAYHQEDYDKLTVENVPDAVINTLRTKHNSDFEVWRRVPEEIRNNYPNQRVPDEILKMAREGKTITNENTTPDKLATLTAYGFAGVAAASIIFNEKDFADIAASRAQIAEKGYHDEYANAMAINRQVRSKLAEKIKAGTPLTDEEKALWRESREKDRNNIIEDWRNYRPDFFAAHLIVKMNVGRISPEEALPQIEELMAKVVETDRVDEFYFHLTRHRIPRRRLTPETKAIVADLMEKYGMDKNVLYPEKSEVHYNNFQSLIKNKNERSY